MSKQHQEYYEQVYRHLGVALNETHAASLLAAATDNMYLLKKCAEANKEVSRAREEANQLRTAQ